MKTYSRNSATAQQDLDKGNIDDALRKFLELRKKVKSGVIHDVATQFAGSIFSSQGDKKQAYELLSSIKKQLNPQGIQILQHLAYDLGHLDEAAVLGIEAYQFFPDYETALINACTMRKWDK